jgi:hypothetical protein
VFVEPLSSNQPELLRSLMSKNVRIGYRFVLSVVGVVGVVSMLLGCRAEKPDDTISASNATTATTVVSASKQEGAAASLLISDQNIYKSVPENSAALAAIYGEKGDGSDAYSLSDGRSIGSWYAYAYRVEDVGYYTVFAHAAKPSETGMPTPGQTVALSQVTYQMAGDVWKAVSSQDSIGDFGGSGRAPNVDTARKPETYTVDPTTAVLAIPSTMLATGGVSVFGYELMMFSKADRHWRYLGKVDAGADYSLSCKDGPATPDSECVRNRGTIRFVRSPMGGLPAIVVELTGTTRDQDGKIRALHSGDALNYRYDDQSSAYLNRTPQ